MAVSRQCKTRGNRTKTGTSQLGVPDSSEAAHHSASSARSRFSPRVGLLTFVASRRRVHQPKTDSAETTVLADEIEDLDTTTPDSADTGIAETSADSLNSASEVAPESYVKRIRLIMSRQDWVPVGKDLLSVPISLLHGVEYAS